MPSSERRSAIHATLRQSLLVATPVLAGLAVGSLPLVRLVYERGAFGAEHSPPLALAVAAFMPGVLAALVGVLLVKAHVLAGRFRLVLLLGLGAALLNAGLNALLGPWLGLVGLAASTSLATLVVTAVAWQRWRQEEGGGGIDGVTTLMVCVTIVLGGLLWTTGPQSIADPRLWGAALPLLGLLALGLRLAR